MKQQKKRVSHSGDAALIHCHVIISFLVRPNNVSTQTMKYGRMMHSTMKHTVIQNDHAQSKGLQLTMPGVDHVWETASPLWSFNELHVSTWYGVLYHGSISLFDTFRSKQNGRHLPDDTFKCIFFDENVWIVNKISLKFVSKCPI